MLSVFKFVIASILLSIAMFSLVASYLHTNGFYFEVKSTEHKVAEKADSLQTPTANNQLTKYARWQDASGNIHFTDYDLVPKGVNAKGIKILDITSIPGKHINSKTNYKAATDNAKYHKSSN
ncbi:MAG: hypothetical protein D6B27_12035 [Gammaproteobacteria bacterium]|nr:MAG: hypothetical protein D6B27_12035 [Gammaproteobacteria bacterium]